MKELPPIAQIESHAFHTRINAHLGRPTNLKELTELLELAKVKGLNICPVGGRNSFGDPFLMPDSLSIDMTALSGIISFDRHKGIVEVYAGTKITDILKMTIPQRYLLTSLSGSLHNTVGGNLSANINGKDSWKYGNFYFNVQAIDILLVDGSTTTASPESNWELFNAIIGGMGILGLVTKVTLKLRTVSSPNLLVDELACHNSDAIMDFFGKLDPSKDDYSYAWIDPYATGANTGRGVAQKARHDDSGYPSNGKQVNFLANKRIAGLPPKRFWKTAGWGFRVLRRLGLYDFAWKNTNGMKFRSANRHENTTSVGKDYMSFQYPLTYKLPDWNYRYYPAGFIELQYCMPFDRFQKGFLEILEFCRQSKLLPEICAIRKMKADPALLSFSVDGFCSTVNFSLHKMNKERLNTFIRKFVAIVIKYNGKIYLPKFSGLTVDEFREMYPEQHSFKRIKNQVDPQALFRSLTSQHLGLTD